MFYFMISNAEIMMKCWWGSEGAVSSVVGYGGTLIGFMG